jgi:hypothetical protein
MGRMREKPTRRELDRGWIDQISALDGRGFWLLWAGCLMLLAAA